MEVLSFLVNFFAIIFAGFRFYVVYLVSKDVNFAVKPLNMTVEVIMLFVNIVLIYLIFKRKLAAGIIYFGLYLAYFGTSLMHFIGQGDNINAFFSGVAILIAFLNFIDLLFNNGRVGRKGDRKTEWFYKTDKYERDDDPRSDKNRYRIM